MGTDVKAVNGTNYLASFAPRRASDNIARPVDPTPTPSSIQTASLFPIRFPRLSLLTRVSSRAGTAVATDRVHVGIL